MSKIYSKYAMIMAVTGLLVMTQAHAKTPVWTFSAPNPAKVTVSQGGSATVQYTVTNQSGKSKNLILSPKSPAGLSASPCRLARKGSSCSLILTINGSAVPARGLHSGPVLCEQENPNQCYQPSRPNRLNISKGQIANYTVGGFVTGLTGTVTLLNNNTDATSVSADGFYTFSTPVADGSQYSVTVETQPSGQICTVANNPGVVSGANVTDVNVSCHSNTTTITVPATGTIPVTLDGSVTNTVTVTNTGGGDAINVHAILPSGWTAVNQASCATIAMGSTCDLVFKSTAAYVAQGNITVTGDNISTPPTMALAFTIKNYLVWQVAGGTSLVIDTGDASSAQVWSTNSDNLGIDELSTSPCVGATDGSCNTGVIEAAYSTPYTNYAAGLCYGIQSDNSGTVSLGTWYLPAICQMGEVGLVGCASGLDNIDTNLVQLGFGGLSGLAYWSSTEDSFNQQANYAWIEFFDINGSGQNSDVKTLANAGVRCVRAITPTS